MIRTIVIGTRGSELARAQARLIEEAIQKITEGTIGNLDLIPIKRG